MRGTFDIRTEIHFSDRLLRCFAERPSTPWQMLQGVFSAFPTKEAVVDGERRLTYQQLSEAVERCARGIFLHGLGAGERVGLLIPNRIDFVVNLLALWRLGAIPVPLNIREAPPEIAFNLNDCAASGLIYSADDAAKIPDRSSLATIRWMAEAGETARHDAAGALPPCPPSSEEAPCCLLYTSGTTGKPKGAKLCGLGIVHSVMHYALHFGLNSQDVALLVVPATHVTGLIGLVMAALGVGAKLVMTEAFSTQAFIALATTERVSFTIMVPAMYNLLLLRENLDRHDLSAWRIGAYGGAVMPPASIEALARLLPQLNLCNAYGATETTSPTTLMPLGTDAAKYDTLGRPVACAEILIMDDQGRELPPGERGEIWIRGPMVIGGYWNRPEVDRREFVSGYWKSGDVGSMSADGFLSIHDRLKDVIIRGGYNIYSAEVENILVSHPAIIEAAVVPIPCPVMGERVHAFVTSTRRDLSSDEIRRYCADHLTDYKIPESLTIGTSALPRNANGKLLKRILREMAAAPGQ